MCGPDFPVMPVEVMTVTLKPANFFSLNPSNDVPRSTQRENRSVLVDGRDETRVARGCNGCP